jgi:hypothetical protein
MKPLHHLVAVAVAAAGLSVVGFSSPANAVTTVDVQPGGTVTVKNNGCKNTHTMVTGDWYDPAATSNEVTITLLDPNGEEVGNESLSNETTGSVDFVFPLCGGDTRPGRYTVVAEATTHYADPASDTTESASGHFAFKRIVQQSSHLRAKLLRNKDRVYKFVAAGQLTRAGRAYTHQKVWLQARDHGDWQNIDATRTLRKGVFGWYLKPNPYTWRFWFKGNRTTKADTSKTFRTPHRHGRVVLGTDPSSFVRG